MAQKKAVTVEGAQFGVYQNETGSYSTGDLRFGPLQVTVVASDAVELIDTDTAPVKLFGSQEAADTEVERLRKAFEVRAKAATGRA